GGALRDCVNGAGDYPQNWYDQGVAVDPNNPERVFFDTFEVWFATFAGTVWNDTTCGYSYSGSAGPVHVDQHALAFVPGSSSILLIGNDGGAHGTTNADIVNQTQDPTWFNMDTGLNTIEFYSGDISGYFSSATSPQASGGTKSFILPYDLFHGGVPGGDDCPGSGVPGGCGHLVAGTTRVWETINGGNASFSSADWYVTNNPITQNMTKQTLGNRSFINQVKYSPKYQSVAMVGTNDANVWIGFN